MTRTQPTGTEGKAPRPQRTVAEVDFVVDETGAPLEVPEDSALRATDRAEQAVPGTSPSTWWRVGLLVLAIVVIVIGLLQLFSGAPSTQVQPGTPTSAPITDPVAPAR